MIKAEACMEWAIVGVIFLEMLFACTNECFVTIPPVTGKTGHK